MSFKKNLHAPLPPPNLVRSSLALCHVSRFLSIGIIMVQSSSSRVSSLPQGTSIAIYVCLHLRVAYISLLISTVPAINHSPPFLFAKYPPSLPPCLCKKTSIQNPHTRDVCTTVVNHLLHFLESIILVIMRTSCSKKKAQKKKLLVMAPISVDASTYHPPSVIIIDKGGSYRVHKCYEI